jgi:hypothetical protein
MHRRGTIGAGHGGVPAATGASDPEREQRHAPWEAYDFEYYAQRIAEPELLSESFALSFPQYNNCTRSVLPEMTHSSWWLTS